MGRRVCGIAGVIYGDRAQFPDERVLSRMSAAIKNRGPDGEGRFSAPGVGFAHRRLSVIDLVTGDQPMSSAHAPLTLCFNGEIYNYKSLRDQLVHEGVTFRTRSDSEVLLEGWRHWGEGVLPKLVGMFAFAVWDGRTKTAYLCRDRLGVKPLYWATTVSGDIAFGSTLDAVLENPEIPRKLALDAFARYLSLGYVAGDESVIESVQRLAPGHFLVLKEGKEPEARCWWNLADVWASAPRERRDRSAVREEFSSLLEQAVSDRLVSDVPLGAFLSGGLDSSTVVSMMAQSTPKLKTFSIGFKEHSYNELPYAERVASALGTEHFQEKLSGSNPALLGEIASQLDEPFADTSIVPTYLLCKMARQHVTVALSGDGGDELLAGYVTQRATALQAKARSVPRFALEWARKCAETLPDSRKKIAFSFKLKQFLRGVQLEPALAHASWRMLGEPPKVQNLLEYETQANPFAEFEKAFGEGHALGSLDRFLYVDYRTWLPGDILTKTDRASMAHGLEVRSPFLDHRLVEFCAGLPPALKMNWSNDKVLLRQTAQGRVPSFVLRRSKKGFNAPVSDWMQTSWKDFFLSTLEETHTPFLKQSVRRVWSEHTEKGRDRGHLLFAVLMGMLWLRKVRPQW